MQNTIQETLDKKETDEIFTPSELDEIAVFIQEHIEFLLHTGGEESDYELLDKLTAAFPEEFSKAQELV